MFSNNTLTYIFIKNQVLPTTNQKEITIKLQLRISKTMLFMKIIIFQILKQVNLLCLQAV